SASLTGPPETRTTLRGKHMRVPSANARPLTRSSLLRRAGLLAVVGLGLLGASCGKSDQLKVQPVHGQVLFQGQPAAQALVIFHPVGDGPVQEVRPVGRVAPDGTFTLTTYREGDGAPAGAYVVTVDWRKPNPGTEGSEPGPSLVPARYTRPGASTLKATITEGA